METTSSILSVYSVMSGTCWSHRAQNPPHAVKVPLLIPQFWQRFQLHASHASL